MENQVKFFTENGKLVEAERIKMRVEYDLEMLTETGYVNGIENYSMYLGNRNVGEAPATLMEFFDKDFLTFIDESHMTIPQIGGMYAGDRARKENLVGESPSQIRRIRRENRTNRIRVSNSIEV